MFLQIESYTEQPYVHVNFVLSEMPESLVMHVFLHLSKRSFWLYRSLTPVFHTFLRRQQQKCFLFIRIQLMVDIYGSVTLGFLAKTPKWTAFTLLRSIS